MQRQRFLALSSGLVVASAGCSGGAQVPTTALPPGPMPRASAPTALPSPAGVPASVAIRRAPGGAPMGPLMTGLSYEKSELSKVLFNASNATLVGLCRALGPSVLRIGGNSVDRTTWTANGGGMTSGAVAPADVDRLAGFLAATGWQAVYGVNLGSSTPALAAAEAAYVAGKLGTSLLALEIGNEPDLYAGNGLRPSTYAYSDFLSDWRSYAAAIRSAVPNAPLCGPAGAGHVSTYALPFARDAATSIGLLTQHYYRANGQAPASTIDLLLAGDPNLGSELQSLVQAAAANNIAGGFRMAETNSFYNGGAPGISDSFGTALWAIDYLFLAASAGASGLNFHGGGNGTGYTPIADDGSVALGPRPLYYGLYVVATAPGTMLPVQTTVAGVNFSAYAVALSSGGTAIVLSNKDRTQTVGASVDLGIAARSATALALSAASLDATAGVTLGGSPIGADGTWSATQVSAVPLSGTAFTLSVPPSSAMIVRAT